MILIGPVLYICPEDRQNGACRLSTEHRGPVGVRVAICRVTAGAVHYASFLLPPPPPFFLPPSLLPFPSLHF